MVISIAIAAYIGIVWLAVRRFRRSNLAVAFSLAPLAPSLVAAAEQDSIVWFVVFAPYAYAFALSGIPFYFLFRRLGWLQIWVTVPTSALLGGVMAWVSGITHLGPDGSIVNGITALQFVDFGAMTGFVFWVLALRRHMPADTPWASLAAGPLSM